MLAPTLALSTARFGCVDDDVDVDHGRVMNAGYSDGGIC